jgi:hypothetical protein
MGVLEFKMLGNPVGLFGNQQKATILTESIRVKFYQCY